MQKTPTGVLIILAYPAEFVSMIPAWYRKPMEWIGMVNEGKTCVGHAAMALIERRTGKIYYGDFGRYITPFGYGRTRMEFTDPDVAFDYVVEFDEQGKVDDEIALFQQLYDHPEKTHGGEVMYASLNHNADFESCFSFMKQMNDKGSIIYDPFGKGRSNCSRFVYDAVLEGHIDPSESKLLRKKSLVTPSPLANVFHGTKEKSYRFDSADYQEVTDKSIRKIISYFFNKPKADEPTKSDFQPTGNMSFLDGIGDQAYFVMDNVTENSLEVAKYDKKGNHCFTRKYHQHPDFDSNKKYKFIHDCNAAWITLEQSGISLRCDVIQDLQQ